VFFSVDASESHNGAVCDGFRWCQSLSDVDVSITVPKEVTRGKQVTVETANQSLCVWAGDKKLVDGRLSRRVRCEETVWSLEPGRCVQVHLEKAEERWWDALLETDDKIDVRNIDPARPLDQYSEEEQMKVQQMVSNRQQRNLNSTVS